LPRGAPGSGRCSSSRTSSPRAPLLVAGFPDAATLPDLALPEGTVLCTDDGSACEAGFPSDWIARNVPPQTRARVYGCGPAGLLASLERLAASRGWASSLSAEAWMACGVGACSGCAVAKADGSGYYRVCVDGPVFDGGAIDWTGAVPGNAASGPGVEAGRDCRGAPAERKAR
jgi:hypothetical protein